MARPRCSRKEPKMCRSSGARVREGSTTTSVAEDRAACAQAARPIHDPAATAAAPALAAVPKNSRLRIFAIGFLLKGCVISPVKRLTLSALSYHERDLAARS